MEDWFASNGTTAACVVAGIVICTLGGLLSLTPDPERPLRFVPVYIVSLALFLCGLGLIMWCDEFPKAMFDFVSKKS